MTLAFAAVLLTAGSFTIHTDTTVAVKSGTQLHVENFGGSIAVSTWAKNAVKLEAEHGTRTYIDVGTEADLLKIESVGRRGPAQLVDMQLTVPKWMELKLNGVYTDLSIVGTEAEVHAETVNGEVVLTGGKGVISLSSVQGGVKVKGAKGKLKLSSVNEAIEVSGAEGEIGAETVNGDVTFAGVTSSSIDASTVNGDICYQGAIASDGHYSFATHNGDIQLGLPDNANATVSVSTFGGDFDASEVQSVFKAKLYDKGGKRFRFSLGSGSAEILLESFQGEIRLVRATEKCEVESSNDHEKEKVKVKVKNKEKEEE